MPGEPAVRFEKNMIVKTDNLLDKYDELWIIFGIDPKTGKEGVAAYFDTNTLTAQPLMTGEADKVDYLIAVADLMMRESGQKGRLAKFTKRETLRTFG